MFPHVWTDIPGPGNTSPRNENKLWNRIGVTLSEDCSVGAASSSKWAGRAVTMEGVTKTLE